MPQLDFGNPLTVAQVVWMFLIFGALYLMLANWALPMVGEVIDSREQRVLADLDSARLSKEQADIEKDRATLHILRRTLQLKQDGFGGEQS